MENCIFCKIANGEIPSATLYEDEDFRVILDLGPASKGHAMPPIFMNFRMRPQRKQWFLQKKWQQNSETD